MSIRLWIDRTFPLWKIPNIRIFYSLTSLSNMWFISGHWIFYWLRFMNYGQLGVMDATCFLFGLIMEVPTGAIADLIGKRKAIITAMILSSIGFLLMGTATGLVALWVGFLFFQAGLAFYSGAAEALAYDTLVDERKEQNFESVISTSGSISTITSVVTTLVGALMYIYNFRATHLGMGVAFFVGWIVSLGLEEPKTDTEKFELKVWWKNLVVGSRQLQLPAIKPFLIVILVLMGTEFIYEWGFIKPAIATSFGFLDKAQALIFASLGIANGMLVRFLPKLRKLIDDKRGLYMLTVLIGIAYMLSTLQLKIFGLVPLILFSLASYFVYPWISIVINQEIDEKYRATTLSTVALLTKIPYVLTAIIAGKMIDSGFLWLFNLIVGIIVLSSITINWLLVRRKSLIEAT